MKFRSLAALVVLVLSATTACADGLDCTDKGGVSQIRIQVPPAIQKLSKNFRVELCQGERCEAVNFASKSTEANGYVSKGVFLVEDTYSVDVSLFGRHWKADTASGLTIIGVTKKGRTVLRHTEQFEFDGYYPNGKDCDKEPSVNYATSVGGDDLVE
ncbi:hypothetical protein ABIE44_002873 [Marmoricola sp. OAE513]|uniref:hypothetical protein n=1 Tax=Marmoricola sp. OAE513 TaxID=2817894 RepID=UPI001AE77271